MRGKLERGTSPMLSNGRNWTEDQLKAIEDASTHVKRALEEAGARLARVGVRFESGTPCLWCACEDFDGGTEMWCSCSHSLPDHYIY